MEEMTTKLQLVRAPNKWGLFALQLFTLNFQEIFRNVSRAGVDSDIKSFAMFSLAIGRIKRSDLDVAERF